MADPLNEPRSDRLLLQSVEKQLKDLDPQIFNGVNQQKKDQIIRGFAFSMQKTHIGPIPDPETLRQYTELIPDGAERIMVMAEKQQNHRIDLEKVVVKSQLNQSNLGQIFALIIGLAALSAAVYTISTGHDWPGAVIGVGGLTGLVTAFINGKSGQKKSIAEKNPKKQ